jgi:hypothetical protein
MEAVIQGAKNSAISQGINVTLGLQDKFSWAAVAAAGVGSGVGYKVGNMVGARPLMGEGSSRDWGNIGRNLVASGASAIASAAARSLVEGSDFKNNLRAAWPGAIGGTIAAAIAGEMGIDVVAKPKQEDPGDGVGTVEPIKLPPGKPIDFPKAPTLLSLALGGDFKQSPQEITARIKAFNALVGDDGPKIQFGFDTISGSIIGNGNSTYIETTDSVTGVDTGRVYFEGIGAGANSTTHSTWFVLPGESTAIRLISNEAGWAFYRGGDVPFNSIGMRVRFEPVAASTNTGAVPTPTLRDQHTAHRQEYLRVSAVNDVQLMQIMGATVAAGAALAAGMFAAPAIAASPGSSTVALDVASGFVPGMEAAGYLSAAGPLALAAHRTGAFENIGEMALLAGGKAAENVGASSAANGVRLGHQLLAEEVANGHALAKHLAGGEFAPLGIRTKAQFQNFVEGIVSNPATPTRYASDGTKYFLDESTRTIVISGSRGEATAFRPDYGVGWKNYLNSQVPRNARLPGYDPVPGGR